MIRMNHTSMRSSPLADEQSVPVQGRRRYALLVSLLVFALAACSSAEVAAAPYVDLRIRTPLPAVASVEIVHLRIGVAAILSPQGTIESYSALASYLAEKLGRPVDLVQRRTYAELNDMVAANEVDLAFICTNAYVVGSEQREMELLLAPEIDGKSVYSSQLIVPHESTAHSMADLRNKIFAFTDPMSFSGRIYPIYLLQRMGETPEHFFSRTFFTYNHDRAIQAVAEGVADGAAVDSLVLAYAMKRSPDLASRIRVIHTSEAFGMPPIVVPPELTPRQKAQIRRILSTMDGDIAGRAVLSELGFDRFVEVEDAAYDGIRKLVYATGVGQ